MRCPEVTLANDFLGAWFRIPKNPFIFHNYRLKKVGKQVRKLEKTKNQKLVMQKSDGGLKPEVSFAFNFRDKFRNKKRKSETNAEI